jgi:SAM-dependent MidA family methyltransferase
VLPAWLAALEQTLRRGFIWVVDYGYGRRDYYRPERSTGTLICHYRHRTHTDPFFLPGLSDITAWVDFSALADAAVEAGLTVAGYTTQGQFLLEALGGALLGGPEGATPEALSAVKTLMLPGEMGERFKVMLLAKRCEAEPLPGRDFRDRL